MLVGEATKEVDHPLERDGAERPEPAPDAHAEAGRMRRHAHDEEQQRGVSGASARSWFGLCYASLPACCTARVIRSKFDAS